MVEEQTPPASANTHSGNPGRNMLERVDASNASVTMAESVVNNNIFNFGLPGSRKSRGRKGGWGSLRLSEIEHDPHIRKLNESLHANPAEKSQTEEEKGFLTDKSGDKPPQDIAETRIWYRRLMPIEKCYVQAVAVLHGAPKHEIQRATEELYRPAREADEQLLEAILQRKHIDNISEVLSESAHIVIDPPLLAKTYTSLRKTDKVRLSWQDTDSNGQSTFSNLVIQVIEEQTPLGAQKGLVGQNLLQRLEELPEAIGGESSWRVPRALGALWQEADPTKLYDLANDWVRDMESDDIWGWRVAGLLEGAFEAEYSHLGQKVYQKGRSTVLKLLDEWTDETHDKVNTPIAIRLGCAIAMTFRVLGLKHLKIALQGLNELLDFPRPESGNIETIPDDIFVAIYTAYLKFAGYGYVRELLAQLALNAERYSLKRGDRKLRGSLADQYLWRRSITLTAVINTFVLLIVYSLT